MSNELDLFIANMLSETTVTEKPTSESLNELLSNCKKRDAVMFAKVNRHDREIAQMQKDIKELQARRLAPAPVEKDWAFWGELALYGLGGALIGVAVGKTVNYLTSDSAE